MLRAVGRLHGPCGWCNSEFRRWSGKTALAQSKQWVLCWSSTHAFRDLNTLHNDVFLCSSWQRCHNGWISPQGLIDNRRQIWQFAASLFRDQVVSVKGILGTISLGLPYSQAWPMGREMPQQA